MTDRVNIFPPWWGEGLPESRSSCCQHNHQTWFLVVFQECPLSLPKHLRKHQDGSLVVIRILPIATSRINLMRASSEWSTSSYSSVQSVPAHKYYSYFISTTTDTTTDCTMFNHRLSCNVSAGGRSILLPLSLPLVRNYPYYNCHLYYNENTPTTIVII